MSRNFRELLDKRNSRLFVNREHEISLFFDLLKPQSEKRILVVTGIGGVGKSFLLSQFRSLALSRKFSVAYTNLYSSQSGPSILADWRESLSSNQGFNLFDSSFEKFGALEADEAEHSLTRYFVQGINKGRTSKLPIVLMIDAFELASRETEIWLSELMSLLKPSIRLVIASRSFHRELASMWAPLLIQIELAPFTQEATIEYLKHHGITDPGLASHVTKITGGLPLAISMLANVLQNAEDAAEKIDQSVLERSYSNVIYEILNRFLRDVGTQGTRDAIEAASVLGEFNLNMLSQVCGRDARDDFERLSNVSFIKPVRPGYMAIHDAVREYIISLMSMESPSRLKELQKRAKIAHLSPTTKSIVKAMVGEQPVASSDLAIQLRILDSEVETTLQKLLMDGLAVKVGVSDDGESLYSLSDPTIVLPLEAEK